MTGPYNSEIVPAPLLEISTIALQGVNRIRLQLFRDVDGDFAADGFELAAEAAGDPGGRYLAILTTGVVDAGKPDAGSIGAFFFKIVIIDPQGKVQEILEDSDGGLLLVPGDRISWR